MQTFRFKKWQHAVKISKYLFVNKTRNDDGAQMFVVFDDFQFFDRMFWRQHNTQVLKCHQLLQWSEEIYSIFIDVTKII